MLVSRCDTTYRFLDIIVGISSNRLPSDWSWVGFWTHHGVISSSDWSSLIRQSVPIDCMRMFLEMSPIDSISSFCFFVVVQGLFNWLPLYVLQGLFLLLFAFLQSVAAISRFYL